MRDTIMKTKINFLILAGVLIFGLATAYAHHSVAATYDAQKEVKLQGKLVLFLFRNPHVFVHIDVPDESGKPRRWTIEWGGAAQLAGQGINRDTFKTGDELIITGDPSRTAGERRAKINTLHRVSDGLAWGTRPGEVVD
jgi:hypothetical protein